MALSVQDGVRLPSFRFSTSFSLEKLQNPSLQELPMDAVVIEERAPVVYKLYRRRWAGLGTLLSLLSAMSVLTFL